MNSLSRICCAALVTLTTGGMVWAIDCTWTGGGSDTKWTTAGNWSDSAVPSGNSDVAIFPSGTSTAVLLDQSISIKTIQFNNAGMTLTFTNGVTLTFDNPGGSTVVASQDATITGNGTLGNGTGTALSYEGTGKVTLSLANTYTGATTIKSGVTVVAQNNAAFGTADSGTTIESGGTLDVGGSLGGNALNLGTEVFTVSGVGVGGNGAIVNTGANFQMNTFGRVEMAGDTTFGGTQRWDLRNNSAYLNMNGHNLTKVGNNNVVFVNTTVTPGAGNIDITSGTMQLEGTTRLNGSSANTLHVASGATLMYWYLEDNAAATPWSLVFEDTAKFRVDGGAVNQDVWHGPVTLNGLTYLDPNAFYLYINGPISGSGSLESISSGFSYLNNTNTYSGTSTVSAGVLSAKYPESLPGYASGKVTVKAGATIAAVASNGTEGWTASQINTLSTSSTFTALDAALGIDTSLADMNYSFAFPSAMGLYKLGTGTLTLNTTGQTINGQIKAGGGELILDGTTINATNVESYIGLNSGDSAKVTLQGNAAWTSILPIHYVWCPILYVGSSGKGVLAIKDSATITHRFNVGQNTGSAGAVYQSGGTVTNWGGGATDARIGQYGFGYYELSGGSLSFKGWSQVGGMPSGVGILKVNGGSFTQLTDFDGDLGISRGGTGVVYVAGGSFYTASDLWVGDQNESSSSGGFADFTVAGGKATVNGIIDMANRDNMRAMVNLNGGVTEANRIQREIRSNAPATVGFNGGTFRARTSGALFGTGSYAPDAVSIYAGGATFNTTNLNCSVSVPLNAPKGLGVSSIIVDATSGYIAPPMVTISGGGGTGATAVAQFDLGSGTVNGITVTCPGFGYTTPPTVTLSGGGAASQAPVRYVYLTPSTSGGLTKLGAGTLALNAANTYAGATEVREGTLRLGNASALSPRSSISVTGGSLDLGGNTLSNEDVTVTGGTINNGTFALASLNKSGSGTLVLGSALALNTTQPTNALVPGLWEGRLASQWDTTTPNPKTSVELTTRAVNGACGEYGYINGAYWPNNSTYVYTGYIWNRTGANVTWTFAENFDDNAMLRIDGATVLNDGTWNNPTIGTVTLTPGPHAFEARFGQGGGGAAGNPKDWWNNGNVSFMVDFQGRNEQNLSNYQLLTDPGDGSLLTTGLPALHGAGLIESVLPQSWNTADDGLTVSRQLTTRAGNGAKTSNSTYAGGLWSGGNHTWIYKGVIWNRGSSDETWAWRFTFDDNVLLKIDGSVVRNVGLGEGIVYQNHTLTPGPHTIEIRFGDGGGDVGPEAGISGGIGGLAYDPTGGGNYILLQDPGDGSLLTTDVDSNEATPTHAVVNVNEGTLRLAAPAIGLYEGRIASSWDTTTANPATSTQTTTRAANGLCGENSYIGGAYWPINSTYVYTGFIWNRATTNTTWTFAENFDDDILLRIDGNTVLDNHVWNEPTKGNITLTPGAHAFEVRLGQGGGDAGGHANDWWTMTDRSFVVDFQGRNENILSNYQILTDPGDGSLFTLTADDPLASPLANAEVNLADGTTLDLNGATNGVAVLAGTGTVTNGKLSSGTVISPAGDAAIGTLALSNLSLGSGTTYRLTVSGTQSDRLTLTGTIDLSGMTIVAATTGAEYIVSTYTIATADGGFIGDKPALSGFPSKYKILRHGTELQLSSLSGMLITLR